MAPKKRKGVAAKSPSKKSKPAPDTRAQQQSKSTTTNSSDLCDNGQPFHFRHACQMHIFLEKFDRFFRHNLSPEHWQILRQWPFQHFLNLPDMNLGAPFVDILLEMFKRWDFDENGFNFKGQLFQTSGDDVSLILGLRSKGILVPERVIKMTPSDVKSELCHRLFGRRTNVHRDELETILREQINGPATLSEWVSMFTIWMFSYILFTRIDRNLPTHLWDYVETLNLMWNVAWGQAVHLETALNFVELAEKVQTHVLTNNLGVNSKMIVIIKMLNESYTSMSPLVKK